MARLAEIIGLSFTDMVDITSWALYLVMFGVCFGKALYDLFGWFGDIIWSLIRCLVAFISKHFPNVRKRKGNKMSKDISTPYTKERNVKCGRTGYYAYKGEKVDVISPKDYGMFLLRMGRGKNNDKRR